MTGLVGHLKNHFKPMYQLYLVMKDCNEPTADEVLYASGKKPFNSPELAPYLRRLDEKVAGIQEAFAKQQAAALVCHHAEGIVLAPNCQ